MKDISKDFRLFAKSQGVSTSVLDDMKSKMNNSIITPYVLEERSLNVTTFDVFSRLMLDKIIFFGSDFNSDSCNVAVAQLMYLNSIDDRDITIQVSSPGGDVYAGLSVIDTMNYIDCDVSTVVIGMAASMGAVLASSGTKGKRMALPHSRIMIHQPSTSFKGKSSDMEIEYNEIMRCRTDLYNILSSNMGKSFEEVEKLCENDKWFLSNEALEIGLIDKVLIKEEK